VSNHIKLIYTRGFGEVGLKEKRKKGKRQETIMKPNEFVIPLHPEALVKDPGDGRYCIENKVDVGSLSERALHKMLAEIESRIAEQSKALRVIDHENFDPLYWMFT